MTTTMQNSRRSSATIAMRRAQIADATLAVVAEHGLQGATMVRIAEAVGLSTAAPYRYFQSREAILMAAYDRLADKVTAWVESLGRVDDVARLRDVLSLHSSLFSADIRGFNAPMFQFRVYLPDDAIRRHVRERTARIFQLYAAMIEDGKKNGVIRSDADAKSVVSDLLAWMYWESLTYLAGFDDEDTPAKSNEMLRHIIDAVAEDRS